MKFYPTSLQGPKIVDVELREDSRGHFARTFCRREFEANGIVLNGVQSNLAYTKRTGTVRGLHYQIAPSAESKLIRCTQGAIYDLIVDLRSESPTYLQHFGVELTAENKRALYVPPFFAHGYQTLADHSEVTYFVGDFYAPELERGIRFDDPSLNIQWPISISQVSDKDRDWPLLIPHKPIKSP